jgi:phosphoadenosine phosphosulfate reductase
MPTAVAPRTATTPPIPDHLAGAAAGEVLAWAVETFQRRFAVVTSFQLEGMVVVDLARRLDPGVRVVTLDTGRLPQETYDLIDEVRARLGVDVELVAPDPAELRALTARHGPNLFRRDQALRQLCCHVRKVAPLDRALRGTAAWATGMRRDGGPTRAGIATVEPDPARPGTLKLNPLAAWTRERAWAYVREHRLPVHPLYAQGYQSIGCAPCTRATRPGESERAGRWWWEADQARECGLNHQSRDERFATALADLRADLEDQAAAPVAGAT